MACFNPDKGTLEMQLYIIFNDQDDGAAHSCPQHLQLIFGMLRPYQPPAMDGRPKVIPKELQDDLIEICRAIHNYSFNIFAHCVNKCKHKLSDIRGYIEQEWERFLLENHAILVVFLQHVDLITKAVANAQTTKQLSKRQIKLILYIFWYWTNHNLLPKDTLSHNKVTLLEKVDALLADGM